MAINSKFMQDDEYNIRGVGKQPENQLDSTSLNELITKTPELTDVLNTDQQALSQEITSPTVAETQSIVPNTPEKPLTRLEKLENMMADYESSYKKDLAEARKKDRMLQVGGALGDVLATYINAQNQKRAMVPGIEVQQGAGIGKIAEMFQTAPEVASDIAQRRQALMKQYAELAKGERSQARLTSEEQRAEKRMQQEEKLTKAQIDAKLKAAQIAASGKSATEFTPYQEKQLKREDEKDLQKISTSITKLGLPTITSAINSIENQLGMTLEEALARNTDNDKTNDVEVPGYGRMGSLAPDVLVGDKSRAFRQDVGSLLNPQISKQFGASQTKGEIERFQKEVGSGTFESESAILRGLSNIKRSAKADLKATYAGYRPELVDIYKAREGVNLQEAPELDPRVELFMKQNNITDKNEAIKILKENGKL